MTKHSDYNKLHDEKKGIRKEIYSKLNGQSREIRQQQSKKIKDKLFSQKEFQKARCIIFYVSMEEEVDMRQMIDESLQMGKTVGIPVIVKGSRDLVISKVTDIDKQCETGPYNIPQPRDTHIKPITYDEIDLVVVPGVAFDRQGNRLGRGKGYYDRFLAKLPSRALTIGLCYDCQVVDFVPLSGHDVPVKRLISAMD